MKIAALRGPMPAKIQAKIPDKSEYAERANYWLQKLKERPKNYRHKRRDRAAVILAGHGVSLRVDRGTLFIRDGFTHYPQERQEYRFFRGDLNLPSRILMLDGNGSISFDVLAWLGQQRIPFIQINWRGEVVTVASESGHSADPKKVAAQIAAHENGHATIIARRLISQKLQNCLRTLREVAPQSSPRDKAIEYLEQQTKRLTHGGALAGNKLLGVEGGSAALYFQAFHGMPIKWKGTGRKPIPRDWYGVGSRTSPFTNTGWRARHPVNAMLNYAYAVLYGLVRTQIVADGLDPNIGLLHKHATKRRDNLTLDLMEPLRPTSDRIVFEMVRSEVLSPADFSSLPAEGVCRLNTQLARRIANSISVATNGYSCQCAIGRGA